MTQRTSAPWSPWPLVKTGSKAQKIDSEWYAENRCETLFLYRPFYRTLTPAAAKPMQPTLRASHGHLHQHHLRNWRQAPQGASSDAYVRPSLASELADNRLAYPKP